MNWNTAISRDLVGPRSMCHLIIVGETRDGQPFCYEDSFQTLKVRLDEIVVSLTFGSINPLEKLHHVCFIEISFRERGVLYHAFVDLSNLEVKKNQCLLTLHAPQELHTFQSRKFARINLPSRTPITCRVVGVRKQQTHQGVAFPGQMLDISGGGLSFITPARLFYPLFLELSFHLPNVAEKFVVFGEIIRVANFSNDSYRIAVEFRNTSDTIINRIDNYCNQHSQT